MNYRCCDTYRRNAVAAHPVLNGMDYLEVLDRDLPPDHEFRQRTLFLHFLKPVAALDRDNLRLDGGDRVRDVAIEWAEPGVPAPVALTNEERDLLAALPDADRVLVVRTNSHGDRSAYRLRLVRSPLDDRAPDGFDPQLAEIEFSFKVECESDFDCKAEHQCPPQELPAPEINYLAKDYASFRRLLLDRIAQLVPDQRDRPAADPGVALAELLAYVGDQLSYRQDAAATEAYLGTARKRISLRRHALLVDYAMHDGCNARTWMQLQVEAASIDLGIDGTRFLTRCPGLPVVVAPGSPEYERALRLHPEVFEPMHAATLRQAHNALPLYAWGDERCCLPRGATRATLLGHFPDLAPGDALLLEELVGPATGQAGDADPSHRHVVRLTEVVHSDAGNPLLDPLNGNQVTDIAWGEDDALPFALCVSSVADEDHGGAFIAQVSIARGNLVLVDHGLGIADEPLGSVPGPSLLYAPAGAGNRCNPLPLVAVRPRFRPRLAQAPLTHAAGFDPALPAAFALRWSMDEVEPCVVLQGSLGPDVREWRPKRDLLNSRGDADEFVAEIDESQDCLLRFGDDRNGRFPESGTEFTAGYRVGNGSAGNVGAGSIVHVVTAAGEGILSVRNPLAARGGRDPESAESVRRSAPEAYRRQERAVTTDDYAEVSERHDDVQNAAATLRWTGSWHTVFVTVDREGGDALSAPFVDSMVRHLDRYRMAGHDLEIDEPIFVPLELALHVCVEPDHFRSDVKRALSELFSSRVLRNGQRGLFHPDNFSFGDPVYLSRLYAAAHAVAGVLSVQVTAFRRQGSTDELAMEEGRIALGRLEIARLDNDPDFPERGVLALELHGGK
jgi:hypothetical protein